VTGSTNGFALTGAGPASTPAQALPPARAADPGTLPGRTAGDRATVSGTSPGAAPHETGGRPSPIEESADRSGGTARLRRRHPLLLPLLVALPLLLALQILIVRPWRDEMVMAHADLEGTIGILQDEIAQARDDLEIVARQEPVYRRLRRTGWFDRQDRLAAAGRLEELGLRHGLERFDYRFLPERRPTSGNGMSGNGADRSVGIVETEIALAIEAVTDGDVRGLLRDVRTALPGTVAVDRLEIARKKPLEVGDLLALEAGSTVGLVEARATLVWRTLDLDPADPDAASRPGEAADPWSDDAGEAGS